MTRRGPDWQAASLGLDRGAALAVRAADWRLSRFLQSAIVLVAIAAPGAVAAAEPPYAVDVYALPQPIDLVGPLAAGPGGSNT